MKGLKLGALLLGLTIIVIAATIGMMWWSYNNSYVDTTTLFYAQDKKDEAVFDNTWKVINQEAQVASKYSEEWRKNYKEIIGGRNYGGEVMKWITEHNPEFSPAMYIKLQNVIEAQRATFLLNQTMLIDYHREIERLVKRFPSSLFVGDREIPTLNIVTSGQTDEIFKTHKEDSVKVF